MEIKEVRRRHQQREYNRSGVFLVQDKMTSKDSLLPVQKYLRIVLIGKVGAGKTAVMNSILRCSQKGEETASQTRRSVWSETETCQTAEVHIGEQTVVIVDTPGLCHAEKEDEEQMEEIKKAVSLADSEPLMFLFVLNLKDRFTKGCQDIVTTTWKTFGEDAAHFAVALFTHGDELKDNEITIKEFIDDSTELKNFVSMCNGGFYVIENNNQDPTEATELLQFINNLVDKNGEYLYTKEMLETAMNSGIRKKLALSVSGCALAGAGVGGVTTYFASSIIGVPVGAAAGGVVGAVMGAAGMVAAEHIKRMKCVIQ